MPTPKKPPRVVNERVYEANIIKAATKPRVPPTILSPSTLGTTSRAYANARGSQANLAIPNSSNATTPGSGLPGNGPARSSGGGGTGSYVSPGLTVAEPGPNYETADLTKNPYPQYYDQLLNYVEANAAARPAEYAAMGEKFKANQEAANKEMYSAYMGSRASTDESAKLMGFDPAIVSQARDLAMRQSQENSDQSLADNLAWLTKSGLLSKQQAEASLYQYAQEKAIKSAGWVGDEQKRVADWNLALLQDLVDKKAKSGSGGGGGGRRGGGGGSSSGGYTDSASEEGTMYNGGLDWEMYQELARTDPAAAAEFMNLRNLNSGDKSLSAAQKRVNDLTTSSTYKGTIVKPKVSKNIGSSITNPLRAIMAASRNVPTIVKTGQANYAKKQLPAAKKSLNANQSLSGDWGTTKWTKKVASKSSQKVK